MGRHLQPRPGEDVAILACLLNVIISEGLYDTEFVAAHVAGLAPETTMLTESEITMKTYYSATQTLSSRKKYQPGRVSTPPLFLPKGRNVNGRSDTDGSVGRHIRPRLG